MSPEESELLVIAGRELYRFCCGRIAAAGKAVRIEAATDGADARHRGAGIWVYLPGRMLRVYGCVGEAPGSHMGFWRTSSPADGLAGWNYRAGSLRRNVTLLAHTRKIDAGEGATP